MSSHIGKGYYIRKSREESLKYGNCYRKDIPSLKFQVKIFDTQSMDASMIQFMRNEISILKLIQERGFHPNLLQLVDIIQDGVVIKVITKFVEGRDFEDIPEQVFYKNYMAITRDFASAINALHNMNIVHRDIKPKNVVYSNAGAVLIDYGVSCSLTQPNAQNISNCSDSPGTLDYIDPLIKDTKFADKSSDIYSFGATMFFALTGEYAKEQPASIISQKIMNIPVGSAEYKQIIFDSLSLDKTRRPSANQILNVINKEIHTPVSRAPIQHIPIPRTSFVSAVPAVVAAQPTISYFAPTINKRVYSNKKNRKSAKTSSPKRHGSGHLKSSRSRKINKKTSRSRRRRSKSRSISRIRKNRK